MTCPDCYGFGYRFAVVGSLPATDGGIAPLEIEKHCATCNGLGKLPATRVVCAWCKRILSEGLEPVSHGICGCCQTEHFPEE